MNISLSKQEGETTRSHTIYLHTNYSLTDLDDYQTALSEILSIPSLFFPIFKKDVGEDYITLSVNDIDDNRLCIFINLSHNLSPTDIGALLSSIMGCTLVESTHIHQSKSWSCSL